MAIAVVGALVVAAAVVAALIFISRSNGSSQPTGPAASAHRAHHHGGVLLKASDVTVTVLNGTTTTNLAHDITHLLDGMGYKTGTPATATDQSETATVVGYLPGHQAAALLVAKSLKLGRASVQPVTATNKRVACPQSSRCTAKVIVTVGTDLASAATTSTPATTTAAGST